MLMFDDWEDMNIKEGEQKGAEVYHLVRICDMKLRAFLPNQIAFLKVWNQCFVTAIKGHCFCSFIMSVYG